MGPARLQGQWGKARVGGREEAKQALLPRLKAPRSSYSQLLKFQAAVTDPQAHQGRVNAAQPGSVPVETFEVGRDSMLGPVGQEHHGGEVSPS